MGGKRPDQYRIAPDEAGATDYKQYPNVPDDVNTQRDKARGKIAGDRHGGDLAEINERILKGTRKKKHEGIDKDESEETEETEETKEE